MIQLYDPGSSVILGSGNENVISKRRGWLRAYHRKGAVCSIKGGQNPQSFDSDMECYL